MTHVFISYAHKDGLAFAERLYDELHQRGIAMWRDKNNMRLDRGFTGEIQEAIQNCTHVVVCSTKDTHRADSYVLNEIAYAQGWEKTIIPILFPPPKCPPLPIANFIYIDFTNWENGIAALLERLNTETTPEIPTQTQRDLELAYLSTIGRQWTEEQFLTAQKKYTALSGVAQITTPSKPTMKAKDDIAERILMDVQHNLFEKMNHETEREDKPIAIEKFDDLHKKIIEYKRVALIGDPGAGKTTTLQRLAFELGATAAENDTAPLPLFVRLGAYDGGDFETFLEANFGGLRIRDYLGSPHPYPRQQAALSVPKALERGVFLLLDGLNETPPEHVQKIQDWIQRHDQTPMIVSCRKLDYTGFKLPLQRIDVAPLSVEQMYLFMGNYLEDADRERLFRSLGGEKVQSVWDDFSKKGETFSQFWERVGKRAFDERVYISRGAIIHDETLEDSIIGQNQKTYGLLSLVKNPFLLFTSIQIFTRFGEVPKNRGQLLASFATLLFEKRGKPASLTRPPWIEEAIQRKALSILAYHMQLEHKGTSADKIWALQVIQKALPRENAEQILYLAASASIIEYGQNVRFVHQLLQEYFAAYEMLEDIRRGVPASDEKYWPSEKWWQPTGWEETAVLLAGMLGDATEVVQWLTPVQPALAYRCIQESGSPCAEVAWEQLANPSIPPIPAYKNGNEIDKWRKLLPQRPNPVAKLAWWQQHIKEDTRPGVGLRANGLPDIDWVQIPAGEFLYGVEKEKIFLPAFEIARYPVTWLQYQAFVEAADGYKNAEWWDFSKFAAIWRRENPQPKDAHWSIPNHPRESVTWYEAMAFCRWLEAKLAPPSIPPWRWGEANQGGLQASDRGVFAGQKMLRMPLEPAPTNQLVTGGWGRITLPTEQQWEKAARGTDGRIFPWGNQYLSGYANLDEIDDDFGAYNIGQTTPVGLYLQGVSPYGVFDIRGNVWEWILGTSYIGNIDFNSKNLIVGGSWNSRYQTEFSHWISPDLIFWYAGFRPARS